MPGRAQGETRNRMTQEEAHRMGLLARMSPDAYTSQLATYDSINEELHEKGLTPRSLNIPAAYAGNLPIPAIVNGG